jgi:glycyl-tRNA synthetase
MTKFHENVVGLDASVLMSPEVWKASGHLAAGFSDVLVECKDCHKRFKGDELKEESPKESLRLPTGQAKIKNPVCPECGGTIAGRWI